MWQFGGFLLDCGLQRCPIWRWGRSREFASSFWWSRGNTLASVFSNWERSMEVTVCPRPRCITGASNFKVMTWQPLLMTSHTLVGPGAKEQLRTLPRSRSSFPKATDSVCESCPMTLDCQLLWSSGYWRKTWNSLGNVQSLCCDFWQQNRKPSESNFVRKIWRSGVKTPSIFWPKSWLETRHGWVPMSLKLSNSPLSGSPQCSLTPKSTVLPQLQEGHDDFVFWHGGASVCVLQPGDTIDTERYIHTLEKLKGAIQKKRPHMWVSSRRSGPFTVTHNFLLHHDNISVHTATDTLARLGEWGVDMVAHPPYSPDLAPCDFSLFPKLKAKLCGHKFQNLEDLKVAALRELRLFDNKSMHSPLRTWQSGGRSVLPHRGSISRALTLKWKQKMLKWCLILTRTQSEAALPVCTSPNSNLSSMFPDWFHKVKVQENHN